MNDATASGRHDDGDTIRYERPDDIDPDTWREIVTQARSKINERVSEALGRCVERPWCRDVAGTPDHQEFHSSRTIDLVPSRQEGAVAAAAAWLTESRADGRVRLVVDASGEVLGKNFELDIDAVDAWRLLATTERGASENREVDARAQIIALIEEAGQ